MTKLVFDFETTTHNKGNPFDTRNFAVSYSVKFDNGVVYHLRHDNILFKSVLRDLIKDATLLIGVNLKFDLHWTANLGIQLPVGIRIWDCQLAEFVLSGQTHSFSSLNELAELYGFPTKLDAVADYWEKGVSTEDIPHEVLQEYNDYDVELTWKVYEAQQTDPRMTPELHKLILLCGLDLLVLQDMEYNGLKYDIKASEEAAEKLSLELLDIDKRLDRYSDGINYNSGDHLPIVTGKQEEDRKSTRLNSSHLKLSRMPSSA